MTVEELYEYFGNGNAAAKSIGCTRQAFYIWIRRGYIPYVRQKEYEKITKGALKANKFSKDNAFILDPVFRLPCFRYYSDDFGMCKVHSIIFKEGKSPRIIFHHPVNKINLISSFLTKNLMQATSFIDKNGVNLHEQDIIISKNKEIIFKDIYDVNQIKKLSKFLIIGNTFEGINNGYSRS